MTSAESSPNWIRPAVAGVLLLYLAAQLAFLVGRHAPPFSDMADYDARALLLLGEHTFQTGTIYGATYHGPAYLVFLAGIYAVAGHSWLAVHLAQALLSTFMLFGIYLLAARLFSPGIGLLSLLLAAAYVPFIAYAHVLMPETLFMVLLVFATYCFVRGVGRTSVLWLGLSGVLCGAASLTRSVGMLFPAVFILWILLTPGRRSSLRRLWRGLILLAVCMVVTLAPWTIHNYLDQRLFIPGDTVGGLNLLIGNHPGADGRFDEGPVWSNEAVARAVAEGKKEGALDAVFQTEALRWIFAHPGTFLSLTGWRMLLFIATTKDWLVTGMGSNVMDGLYGFTQYYTYVLLFLAVAGGVAGLWRGRSTLLPLLVFSYFLVVVSLFYFQTRYRLPAMPFVAILAAYGLSLAWLRRPSKLFPWFG